MKINLLTKTQTEMLNYLPEELEKFGYTVETTESSIFGYSESFKDKPLLVAHLDTINTHRGAFSYVKTKHKEIAPCEEDILVTDKYILLSPEANSNLACLGADDRVGVSTILDVLEQGYRPNILFTTDEEIGCKGTGKIIKQGYHQEKLEDSCIYIQIDRGAHEGYWNEVVFYDHDMKQLEELYNEITCGFTHATGSYTDVAELGEYFNKPLMNVSASYKNEHTREEFINLEAYRYNLTNLCGLLDFIKDCNKTDWKYIDLYNGMYSEIENISGYNTKEYAIYYAQYYLDMVYDSLDAHRELRELIDEYNLSTDDIYAIGDSLRDLNTTGYKIFSKEELEEFI